MHGDDQNLPPAGGPNSCELDVVAPRREHFASGSTENANDIAGAEPLQTRHQAERASVSKLMSNRGSGVNPSTTGSSSLM